ncbi:MAG: class I SAM-dependent methyltransferase [Rhodospirillaceae bacterium]|jgi:2-polyprenyl-3-methyl-5-hydroxy-6-metoxy-1,4-benzoquinol methylase|nr:class I SAM-dependent methyltransferase [Rhodospirillaceae bacterium]MBT5239753.1 class I SAM-dependent methyltransferase [Rhodospirillaceae bacterium]MBT6089444.1 class I SAM-dependent methyltransferase [Rhodospirillaceae bacterium]
MTDSLFPFMNRRSLFTTAAAAASAALLDNHAEAREMEELTQLADTGSPRTMDVRGRVRNYVRFPHLDMESKGNFLAGLYVWRQQELEKTAAIRAVEILNAAGVEDDPNMPMEKAVALLEADPIIAMTGRARHSHQKLKYQMLQTEYYKMADPFLEEMERADKMHAHRLELNPSMDIPEYTAHEIHSMPGGYVGDDFAGHMYHAGTDLGAYVDVNYHDRVHMTMARNAIIPEDGKVRRILDIGTSIGQFATSMKRRFPDAEVWGIDIGAPMVRYAHMKALDMGQEVNFAQRLAEDTGFPDGHFDIVTSNLLFHEVNTQASKDIIKEVGRVLRTGGTFSATDQNNPMVTAHNKFTLWYNYRWNHEDWYLDWHDVDFPGEMRKSGLKVTKNKGNGLASNYIAIKT